MAKSRQTGDLVSDSNIFVDIANDRVGIGTTNPQAKLQIRSLQDTPTLTWNGSGQTIVGDNGVQLAIGRVTSNPFGLYLQGRASNNAERVILLNPVGGDVGIGTDNPQGKLSITGQNPNIRFDDSDTTNNGEITLDNTQLRIEVDEDNTTDTSQIVFRVDGSDKCVISAGGSFGIGSNTPQTKLEIRKDTSSTFYDTTIDTTLLLSGTPGAGDGNYGGSIGFSRLDSVGRINAAIAIKQTSADPDQCGLSFFTHNSSNTGSPLLEAVSINHTGYVGIGTTNPVTKLQVYDGNLNVYKPTVEVNIQVESGDTSVAAFRAVSPYRNWRFGIQGGAKADFVIRDATSSANRLGITSAGEVIIGSNATPLVPTGTASQPLQVTGGAYVSGFVGIGTTVPTAKLHVVGDVRIRSGTPVAGGEQNLIVTSSDVSNIPATISQGSSVSTLQIFSGGMDSGSRRGGQIDFVAGAATTDPGTLIFRTGIATGGTSQPERVRIDASGNVGIGTDNPQQPIHLLASNPAIRLQDTGSNTSYAQVSGNGGKLYLQADDNNVQGSSAIEFHLDGDVKALINSSGNVGIGITDPTTTLSIGGTVSSSSGFVSNGDLILECDYNQNNAGGDSIIFKERGSERVRITGTGNVGIGTTNPTSKLQVQGDTNINNTLPTTVSYASSFSVAGQETSPQEVSFSNDGKTMYVLGSTGDDITWYTLSTPWDITTSTHVSQFSVAGQESGPVGLYFKPDGTKFYVVGTTTNDAVYQYSCRTPWDLTTASYDSVSYIVVEDTGPTGVEFKPDGTRMYVVGATNDSVYQYSLSTPWDLSTVSYGSSFSTTSQENTPTAIRFSLDGTKLLLTGSGGDDINYYNLSTPWDITTTSFVGIITSVGAAPFNETSPAGLYWKPDGTRLYLTGSAADTVWQFNMTSDADLEVTGKTSVYGNLDVYENITAYGELSAYENAYFYNKVGIGTTNPDSRLSVVTTGNTFSDVDITNTNSGTSVYTQLALANDASTLALQNNASSRTTSRFGSAVGGWGELYLTSGNGIKIGTTIASPLIFGTNDAERVRIDENGNVGIGTTAPGSELDVQGNIRIRDTTGNSTFTSAGNLAIKDNSDAGFISFHTAAGTRQGYLQSSDTIGLILAQESARPIVLRTEENQNIIFQTNTNTDGTGLTGAGSKLTITGNGLVGIGTTNPLVSLNVVGQIRISTLAGAGNRAVYSDPTGTLTNSSSDETLKENVLPITYGLDTVCQLNPIFFNWIDTERFGPQREIGLIAQQVQSLIPEVVGVNYDETLSLDYSKLTSVLIKSIQELKVENDLLRSEIEAIKQHVGITSINT